MAYLTISKYRQVPSEDEADLYPERGRELSPMSTHTNYDDAITTTLQNNHHNHHIDANKIDGHAYKNHNNNCNQTISSPECNQIGKRPDQADNRRPTLGHLSTQKPNTRYRQGYHYQPVASTSQFSPTFVFGKYLNFYY